MKCTKCKKQISLPNYAYLNLESYNVGGTVLVSSDCCGKGYLLKMNVSYSVTEYTGNKKEDNWGNTLTK